MEQGRQEQLCPGLVPHIGSAIPCLHAPRRPLARLLLLPSSSSGAPFCFLSFLPQVLESTEGQRKESPRQTQAVPQKGTDLGATCMYFYSSNFFCNVFSYISINKQALTLPVDALNALLHSKHGNELVTWKVLSLTWAVHVQGGKKPQSHKYNNLCRNLSLSPSFYNDEIQAGFLL